MPDDAHALEDPVERAHGAVVAHVHDALAVRLPERGRAGLRRDAVHRDGGRRRVLTVERRPHGVAGRRLGRGLVGRAVEEVRDAEAVPVELGILHGPDHAEGRERQVRDRRRGRAGDRQTGIRIDEAERQRRAARRLDGRDLPGLVRPHRDEAEVHLAEAREVVGRDDEDEPARRARRGGAQVDAVGGRGVEPSHEGERRLRAARRVVDRVDLAVRKAADARRVLARPCERRRARAGGLPDLESRRRLGAARDQRGRQPRPAVAHRRREVVDEIGGRQVPVLLLLAEEVPERRRRLGAPVEGAAQAVVLRKVVSVPELVERERLERLEQPLLEVEALPRLAEVDRAALDVGLQRVRQAGGRGARGGRREAVREPEQPDVSVHEALRQEVREAREDERRGRQRDARLSDARAEADDAGEPARRLERRRDARARHVRDEAVLERLGGSRRERRDRLREGLLRVGLVGARDVLAREVHGHEVLRGARQVRHRDVERVGLARPDDVGVVEGELEARVDDLDRGLHDAARREDRPAGPREVRLDLDSQDVRAGHEAFDRPARRSLLGRADRAQAVRREDGELLSGGDRRRRGRETQDVARREPERARHVLQRRTRAVRRAVRDDDLRVEELVQERDAAGEDDRAVERELRVRHLPGAVRRRRARCRRVELERDDVRRLPAPDGARDGRGQPVEPHGRLVERLREAVAGIEHGQLDRHGGPREHESDGERERVEVLLRDRDPARLEVREREARDAGRREEDLPHVERREGRLGVREDAARRRLDEPDVRQQVVALALEAGEEERPARRRLVRDRLRELGPRKLADDREAGRRPRRGRPARSAGAVAGSDARRLADVDRLLGVGRQGVGCRA